MPYILSQLTIQTNEGPSTAFAALTQTELRQISDLDPNSLRNRILLTVPGTPSAQQIQQANDLFRRSFGTKGETFTGLNA